MKTITKTLLAVTVAFFSMHSLVNAQGDKKPATFTAEFKLEEGKKTGVLIIRSKMAKGHYIYALTQKKVPPPTKIKIAPAKTHTIKGDFKANKKPTVIEKDEIFNNRIEKHYGEVAFAASISVADDPKSVQVPITIVGQVCSDQNCTLLREKIVARFSGYYKPSQSKK